MLAKFDTPELSSLALEVVSIHVKNKQVHEVYVESFIDCLNEIVSDDISADKVTNIIVSTMQVFINKEYTPEHVSPKFLAIALIFMKAALQWSEGLKTSNIDLLTTKSIEELRSLILKISNFCQVEEKDIPGLVKTPISVCNS